MTGCGGDGSLDQQDPSERPENWQPGGGATGSGDSTAASHTLEMTMWDCPDPFADTLDGCSQSSGFDAQKAAVLRVMARRDGSGSDGELVNVYSDKGSLIPADGRVLTGEDGSALLRIQADDDEGVVAISASYADATTQIYAQINAIQAGLTVSTSLADGQVLSDGSTMAVTASLTVNGQPYLDPLPVTFSSTCALGGKAEIDEQVLSQEGQAVATYRSTGCEQQDQITATLTLGSSTATDSVTVPLAAVPIASIQYLSATPDYLQLEGTGGVRTTTLMFQVLDQNGQPKQGVDVALSPASGEERFTLNTLQARSDNQGMVSVTVTSKNLPGPFRVKAEVVDSDPLIVAVSQELRVGTGLPDKDSFDLSFSVLNPQAWPYNGVRVLVTASAGDHFNNPVPDGTAISFITDGGLIEANCHTTDGHCSVDWFSQDPRPEDGRVTVTAFIEGEESFDDANGNGFYDQGEWDGVDEHEVYIDANENGQYDVGEVFIDRNGNGQWDGGDSHYNGLLCRGAPLTNGDCSRELVDLNVSGVIAMSGANPKAYFCYFDLSDDDGDGDFGWYDCWNNETNKAWEAGSLTGVSIALACVMDEAPSGVLNPAPAGTKIEFTAGGDLQTSGRTSYTQISTSGIIYSDTGIDNRTSCGLGGYFVELDTTDGGGELVLEVTYPDSTSISKSMVVNP
ncbi:hypothetical protein FCL40_06080 [Ferrimonas sediminicola]|uniref:Big-1 domain-containing protein n=1 Tax=Ferrimonas sediminicola TaxID=2569538 RepID=A0A4U1BGY5_9GAMM|nr:hypothetical protein [Ferrimonas sediminicola]TKB49725.1 hypothetical protein FCL40_06080 [Ferrimonas sediminicola]